MAKERLTVYTIIVLFLLVLGVTVPFLPWRMKEESPLRVSLAGSEDWGGERSRMLLWPFFYDKITTGKSDGDLQNADMTLLSAPVYTVARDDEALSAVDRIKADGVKSALVLCDGYSLTETVHPLYRARLEDFLQIRNTGWVVKYERDNRAQLIFRRVGETIILKGGEDFSGKPPLVTFKGRSAPVYTWIPIYAKTGSARVTAEIDLGLTEEGKNLLRDKGLPTVFPLTIEGDDPLVRTAFFAVDIPAGEVKTGTFRFQGKEAYLSRMALFFPGSPDALYWRVYIPWLRELISRLPRPGETVPSATTEHLRFSASDGSFFRSRGDGPEEPFYVKGVNLGPALPGTWFTQFPEDEHLYYRWFTQMGDMNLNAIRLYTLLPPSFYRTLGKYNRDNREKPLYLIQEIWPEEHPEGNNYLNQSYDREYAEEIERTIDALHGQGAISRRTGRAWGEYDTDVSPWILAFLLGRELEPDEVLETNRLNRDAVYQGRFVSAPEGPAVEAWLAASCDRAVSYESDNYGTGRPVGIVSWPILDRMRHPVEWTDPELAGRAPSNDKAVVDINRLTMEDDSFGGLFGAYHIYPNYPDFMNNQASYGEYTDEQGAFRYGGYLKEFMENHTSYPALVAEYGLSTSAATAHFNPDGYHHGGLTEEEQAQGIIRMTEAIRREGYAGGLIFEWIDEWAKKTWTTEPFMVPYDRQALWHNALDPEQNYGIMTMKGISRLGSMETASPGFTLKIWGNESHLYLSLNREEGWKKGETLFIGLDTYDRTRGIFSFPESGGEVPTGMEALVKAEPSEGTVRVLLAGDYSTASSPYASTAREGQTFRPVEILVNRAYRREDGVLMPPLYETPGILRQGELDQPVHSFTLNDKDLVIRIPWGLLNVSDPSEGTVLDDPRGFTAAPQRDQIRTSRSESILIYLLLEDEEGHILERLPSDNGGEAPSYRWEKWDVPVWTQEEKKSVEPLSEYFSRL